MYLSRIYPQPKKFEIFDGEPFRFGSRVTMKLGCDLPEELLNGVRELWYKFAFTASGLTFERMPGSSFIAVIGQPKDRTDPVEYYDISVDEGGVLLRGSGADAMRDGFKTLVQLITPVCLENGREAFSIDPCLIVDRPTIPFRAVHLCIFPESAPSTIEKAIELAGLLKLTHVVLEFWGTYPYRAASCLSWPNHSFSRAECEHLVSLCRAYGMEVIPMINHFGHATFSRGGMGRHTVLNQDPRMQLLYEPDGWTFCLSNPDTYKLLAELRADFGELCGKGSYFHIGCDEADSYATCPICRKKDKNALLAEFLNHLTEDICAGGRRPILWHDMLIDRAQFPKDQPDGIVANGGWFGTAPVLDMLDRRAIIADWQYSYSTIDNPTTPLFNSKGFDTIVCPWDNMNNIRKLCEDARSIPAYGVMLTTWHHLPPFLRKMPQVGDYLWQDGRDGYAVPAYNEPAALLRRVHASPLFEESGWAKEEVPE